MPVLYKIDTVRYWFVWFEYTWLPKMIIRIGNLLWKYTPIILLLASHTLASRHVTKIFTSSGLDKCQTLSSAFRQLMHFSLIFDPITPKSDQFQMSPPDPHQKYCITQYEELGFSLAYSDGRWLSFQFSLPRLYIGRIWPWDWKGTKNLLLLFHLD